MWVKEANIAARLLANQNGHFHLSNPLKSMKPRYKKAIQPKKYSAQEIGKIIELHASGNKNENIARATGRSQIAIVSKLYELGLTRPRPNLLQEARELAARRGGKCLTQKTEFAKDPISWQCAEGHQWEQSIHVIRRGSWCSECVTTIGERICRVFFEKLFNAKFPRTRPKWLRDLLSGQPLELDGYSEQKKIAFEHQGSHHFKIDQYFIKTHSQLKRRISVDQFKVDLCRKNGVRLFIIPSIPEKVSIADLNSLVIAQARKLRIRLPKKTISEKMLRKAFLNSKLDDFREIQYLAKAKGGQLLSQLFLGWTRKHRFRCGEGHEWEAVPNRLKREGKWCERCAGVAKKTIEEVRSELSLVLKKNSGQLITDTYESGKLKLEFECAKGHSFSTLPVNIMKGHWCPDCAIEKRSSARRERTLNRALEVIVKKGGRALTREYKSTRQKILVKCAIKTHRLWLIDPIQLARGTWCAKCANNAASERNRTPIATLLLAIKKNKGRAVDLSGYSSRKSNIIVRCSVHGDFHTTAGLILDGHWCRKCGAKRAGLVRRDSIALMKKIAKSRGGICLSTKYTTGLDYLNWRCHIGHEWPATGSSVKGGSWCPECAKKTMGAYKKLTIAEVKRDAHRKHGRLISRNYLGSQIKHQYKCEFGHLFDMSPSRVRVGHWCNRCVHNPKLGIKDIQAFAKKHGLVLLSTNYLNAKTIYKWKCLARNHTFERTYDKIKQLPKCRVCMAPSD